MPFELDTIEVLEAYLRRGGTLHYRGTKTFGVIEADENESAFVLGDTCAEGASIDEAVRNYARAHLGLGRTD